MKIQRFLTMIMVICLCFALIGCSGAASQDADANPGNGLENRQDEQKENTAIDVDLTQLSSTMVYAEVYAMMESPENYVGKTVKMDGNFALYQAVDANGEVVSDALYFACVIADATSCCSQGIEFVLEGEHAYPDDYPEIGSNITVTGEFQTYVENGYLYVHLVDATLS